MRKRPSWNEYFLNIARVVAGRSACLRAQVGAVIVDSRQKIKSTGYNGPPHGVESCLERGFCYRIENNIPSGTRYETCRSIHAEQNAIIQAGEENTVGSVMYLYGHDSPCIFCKRFILQAGIEKLVLRRNENAPILEISPRDWIEEL